MSNDTNKSEQNKKQGKKPVEPFTVVPLKVLHARISDKAKLLYMYLASNAESFMPDQKTIREQLHWASNSTVIKVKNELIKNGMIKIRKEANKYGGTKDFIEVIPTDSWKPEVVFSSRITGKEPPPKKKKPKLKNVISIDRASTKNVPGNEKQAGTKTVLGAGTKNVLEAGTENVPYSNNNQEIKNSNSIGEENPMAMAISMSFLFSFNKVFGYQDPKIKNQLIKDLVERYGIEKVERFRDTVLKDKDVRFTWGEDRTRLDIDTSVDLIDEYIKYVD